MSFKNLACLFTYLKVTELPIYKHIIKHADQASTIFPSLPNKNSVYILFKTLKSDFLYMILLCLLVSSNLHLHILRSSSSSVTEKQFYLHMGKKQEQTKQNQHAFNFLRLFQDF